MLKKKQRIRLYDAAVLIGVCDIQTKEKEDDQYPKIFHSAMLNEGEVFCQIEP